MIRRARWWLIAVAVAVAAGIVLTVVAWPDEPLTEDECRDLFGKSLTGDNFPEECQDWLGASVDQIEQQAAIIGACQDAVVEAHAERWTPELKFTGADTEESPSGDIRVTGTAESVNQIGETQHWTYLCTVSVDEGTIDVLQAGTDAT
jgi:hypothetical protein